VREPDTASHARFHEVVSAYHPRFGFAVMALFGAWTVDRALTSPTEAARRMLALRPPYLDLGLTRVGIRGWSTAGSSRRSRSCAAMSIR
jgi:hypothetical protein